MQFKKVDVLISENLTKEQLKEKVLTELNKISRASNPSISYIANIHDIFNGKYWICMDSETKETMGAADELIDLQSNLINAHTADFNNPHRTTVSNLTDTTITNPQRNQALVYDGTKWVNKNVALDGSNYAKKNEANIFTKKQSGIDGTEDANFVTLRQLKTKVGLTGNETIAGVKTFSVPPVSATNPTANNQVANKSYVDTVGNSKVAKTGDETIAGVKTFSSSIVIPNATANNHSLPLGQADSRYAQLLTQNLEWTVGTGGDFEDLQAAINEIHKYNKSQYFIKLKIKNGYTITSSVTIYNLPVSVEIVGENGRSDELIVDLNNTARRQFGLYSTMSEIHIHDITIRATSNNNSLIYISTGTNGSIYNVDLIGMSFNTLALYSSGNIIVNDLNIQNNYQGVGECYDLSVGNTNLQIGANVKFLSNNPEKLTAVRAATNAKIGSVWWAAGIDISGNYKVGLQVDGGGVIDNPNIAMTGNIGTKYSQTPGQWTTSGYISTNR